MVKIIAMQEKNNIFVNVIKKYSTVRHAE